MTDSKKIKQEVQCVSPMGELMLRTWCMPRDANPSGDIFGGWTLSQMDIAGAMMAHRETCGRTVTIAVDKTEFHEPMFIGDTLCCYARVKKVGTTSITIEIEAWATRKNTRNHIQMTSGIFTYVAIDENRNPRKISKN